MGRGDRRETRSLTCLEKGPSAFHLCPEEGGSVLKAPEFPCCHLVEKVPERPRNKDGNHHLGEVKELEGRLPCS